MVLVWGSVLYFIALPFLFVICLPPIILPDDPQFEIQSLLPETYMDTDEVIEYRGYPVENHNVVTKDGYILRLHRIPYGKYNKFSSNRIKPPVYLQHGLLGSGFDFVINNETQSLAFLLADNDYDVWIGNFRGNFYSRRHTYMDPNSKEFWDFSIDEMAKYDLPASIDYVLRVTGQNQTYYIGHSLGNTAFFAMTSSRPIHSPKIKLMIALAPMAFLTNTKPELKYLMPLGNPNLSLFDYFGVSEILPTQNSFSKTFGYLCSLPQVSEACKALYFSLQGDDYNGWNSSRMGVLIAHFPAGTSARTVSHSAQFINSKKFTHYDFGDGNMEKYNQATPPHYDVSKVTVPVALFWGDNDWFASHSNVALLRKRLRNVVCDYKIPRKKWNHCDFFMASDAYEYQNKKILDLLSEI